MADCIGTGCAKEELMKRLIAPIDMVLHCPECHTQHIDAPHELFTKGSTLDFVDVTTAWRNPPHRSHLCHHCGTIWRPADVPTNGVQSIKTRGEKDTWP